MNKLSTLYKIYSLSLFNGGKSRNISGKHWLSLRLYSFLYIAFKYSAITLIQLYVKVSAWFLIGLNFNCSKLMSVMLQQTILLANLQLVSVCLVFHNF